MGKEPTESSRPRHRHKVLGAFRSGKMHVVPKVVIAKMQAYPAPKNVKEVQAFVQILGVWRIFNPHLAQYLCPLCPGGGEKKHVWD